MITFTRSWRGYAAGTSVSTLADTIEALAVAEGAAVYGGVSYPLNSFLDADNRVQAQVDEGGKDVSMSIMFPPADSVLSKYGRTAADICLSTTVVGVTTCAHVLSNERPRFSSYTRKATPSSANAELRFPGLNITADPDDQSLSIDVYIEQPTTEDTAIAPNPAIYVNVSNPTPIGANYKQFQFTANFLRQGWNTLKMRSVDTVGGSTSGNNAFGVGVSQGGTGVDFLSTIQYVAIQFVNMSGFVIHVDQVRRSAKAKPMCVIGFDAAGSPSDDTMFTEKLAPMMASYGAVGYVTFTNIYEAVSAGSASWSKIKALQDTWGWGVLNHTWSHGATEVGAGPTLASVTWAGGVATATWTTAHNITIGKKFRALIVGVTGPGTPANFNGVYEFTATTTTTATYATAESGAGACTGTIKLYTYLAQVLSTDTTENRRILKHELTDTLAQMKAAGMGEVGHTVAYPNNSVPELNLLQAVCSDAGIQYGRSVRGGFVAINEFGIDNPLHFGAFVMDSGNFATTTSFIISKVQAAVSRGEHIWIYGHYIQDETTAGGVVDLEYAPGQNGNPAPPSGALSGTGGWWYLGQLRRVFDEAIMPAVRAGTLELSSVSGWAKRLGYGVGK